MYCRRSECGSSDRLSFWATLSTTVLQLVRRLLSFSVGNFIKYKYQESPVPAWLASFCAQPSCPGGGRLVALVTRHCAAGQNFLLGFRSAVPAHGRYTVRHLGHR